MKRKRSDIYGIYTSAGRRRRISGDTGISGWTRLAGRAGDSGDTRFAWDSRRRAWRFSGGARGAPGGVAAPTAPPPQFVPQAPAVTAYAVDPGGIRGCLFRNTYIWLNNGEQFWFYPVFVGRSSVAGFRWNGFFWGYYGVDLNRVSSFTCF